MSNTSCQNAEPNSTLAKFCNCQMAVKSIQAQLADYNQRKKQFEADHKAYNASLDLHNQWTTKEAYARGVSSAPYPSYEVWLSNNPEPTILPVPKAPSFVSDTSTVLCCSQRFNNIQVPSDSGPQFQNVVQQCSTQLNQAIRLISMRDSSSSDGTNTTQSPDGVDISGAINNGNGANSTTVTTSSAGVLKNIPVWLIVLVSIMTILLIVYSVVQLYNYFSSS